MILGWILKRHASHSQETGLFGYLVSRDQNKSRINLETARQEATKDIIAHLPDGAVFREGSPNGWREILMPPATRSPLFFLPVEHRDSTQETCEITDLPLAPRALAKDDPPEPIGWFGQP